MSELALTLLRFGFLLLLWLFVLLVVSALRRDLAAPADAPVSADVTAAASAEGGKQSVGCVGGPRRPRANWSWLRVP